MNKAAGLLILMTALVLAASSWASDLEDLARPRDREYATVTGWEHRTPTVPGWVPETVWQQTFTKKYVRLAPHENYVLADLEGPGIINRIFFTLPVSNPRYNLRGLVLKIYWDDEPTPSVLSPLGDFFGAPFGKYVSYDSEPMSMQGGGMVCRFPMPFARRARVVIENGWDREAQFVFFGVSYYRLPELPPDTYYFHALWRRTYPTVPGEPHLVADLSGPGNFVGLQLFLQNRSTFVGKDFYTLMQPEGFGMGNLEGWEEIFADGELIQHGTGTEEYFNAGAYFTTARYDGIYEGVHLRDYLTGRASTYRFQVQDPIPYRESLRLVWHHGLLDSIEADYASIAYWYQAEPHREQVLPGLADRMPSGTLGHAVQAIILGPLVFGNEWVNAMSVE